mmetsp:Transcript_12718/g.14356  ORF Transcript_12718/g.14356 Transcript_12718/m.14356 type:complete len:197 (+) Transcript_12718:38-628(+)
MIFLMKMKTYLLMVVIFLDSIRFSKSCIAENYDERLTKTRKSKSPSNVMGYIQAKTIRSRKITTKTARKKKLNTNSSKASYREAYDHKVNGEIIPTAKLMKTKSTKMTSRSSRIKKNMINVESSEESFLDEGYSLLFPEEENTCMIMLDKTINCWGRNQQIRDDKDSATNSNKNTIEIIRQIYQVRGCNTSCIKTM